VAKGDHLGELEQVVLLAVARLSGEAHAGAIQREIGSTIGRVITAASVHVTLSRLERKRFVSPSAALAPAGEGGRPRKVYRVTLQGILELQSVRVAYARLWDGLSFDPLQGT
jgi:DNA-binding PadR family transcriptional regulator